MNIEALSYPIPPNNIPAQPREIRLGRRDLGRMLLVDRLSGNLSDSWVLELPNILSAGDVFVVNNSRRIPGILFGTTNSGNQVELRFATSIDEYSAICRIYPDHAIKEGTIVKIKNRSITIKEGPIKPYGHYAVQCNTSLNNLLIDEGMPIPSLFSAGYWKTENYNPFYSSQDYSYESPLAGLHLTPELKTAMEEKGIIFCSITLHSNASWLPFLEHDINDHEVQKEKYIISESTADIINNAKSNNNKIIACGTTVMRALESSYANGNIQHGQNETNLYIKPGHEFNVVNSYFTNFHHAKSSLMVLDTAFCGYDLLMRSYEYAALNNYAFLDYGDAIFYI